MQKLFLGLFFILTSLAINAKATNTVSGFANHYIGKEVNVYFYEDYISLIKTKVASTKVSEDGKFSLSFYNEETRKVHVEIGKNYFSLYLQPNATYKIELADDGQHQSPVGVETGIFFLDLDSTDINYKIIMFENEQMDFLQGFYNQKSMKSTRFVSQLDTFKINLTKQLENETDDFFKTYVKYAVASLDNLAFVGQRNEYEKYDFYIKNDPVAYQNDRYMDYILHYYQLYETELSNEVGQELYKGVIKSSPSLIMNALGGDYALKNVRLRELVLIRMLSEMYFSEVYPKTNVLEILDSLSTNALFEQHKGIADRIILRLTELKPGTRLPNTSLTINGKRKFISGYKGKHVYFQFINIENSRSLEDVKLMHPLNEKYSKYIDFVTVLVVDDAHPILKDPDSFMNEYKIAWDFAVISKDDSAISSLKINNYPYYLLIDAASYIVASPALSPRPNNEYETIERSLHGIARYYKSREQH